jgi:putative flippase GtrA
MTSSFGPTLRSVGLLASALRRGELARLVRYALVGATNTAITLASYALLVAAGVPPFAASALGFSVGAINGYQLNRRWTFAGGRSGWQAAARYVAVQALGAGASAAGVALASGDGLGHLPAELVILPAVTLLTYVLARTVVFAPARA